MIILPIGTSIRPRRTPYVNYALIAVNILFFFLTYYPHRAVVGGQVVTRELRPAAEQFMLHPQQPVLYQFLTYAFLHGGLLHIFGNMYFLYLFGNNVNDKLGHIGYLCLYLAGAIFAGVGHSLVSNIPVLGASGAVAAITGAYLILFPQTLISICYWMFFFIGTIEVSALYFILFKLIFWDNIIEPRFAPAGIAYSAHLAGYAFGIAAMLFVLATGLMSSSGFDLWSMIRQFNRRRRFHDVVSTGYDPFTGRPPAKRIKVKQVETEAQKQQREKINHLRNEIGSRITQRNLPAAAELYIQLMELDTNQVPPRQYLLDIANQLASEDRHIEAAQTYEKFLEHYSDYEYVEQVRLMLGLIYARYLNQPASAAKHLRAAEEKLSDETQLKMCRDELAKLQH